MMILIAAAVNLVVGLLIGLTGVAGFLLPMFYAGSMDLPVAESLALSFAAFVVSGILGAWNYHKAGNLDLKFGLKLSAGSLIGAVVGVRLNQMIPEETVKILLYTVVLLSGISILLRKDRQDETSRKSFVISDHLLAALLLGFVTAVICSLSGAGGPVLVMPLLVVLGIPVRTAVGAALFNSIFIGVPACIGYMGQCNMIAMLGLLAVTLAAHAVGVLIGSKNAVRINQGLLKKGIAIFSILIALWKLFA